MLARLVAFLALLAISVLATPAHTGLFRQARADAQAYEGAYDNTFYRGTTLQTLIKYILGYGSPGMNMRFEGQGNNWY